MNSNSSDELRWRVERANPDTRTEGVPAGNHASGRRTRCLAPTLLAANKVACLAPLPSRLRTRKNAWHRSHRASENQGENHEEPTKPHSTHRSHRYHTRRRRPGGRAKPAGRWREAHRAVLQVLLELRPDPRQLHVLRRLGGRCAAGVGDHPGGGEQRAARSAADSGGLRRQLRHDGDGGVELFPQGGSQASTTTSATASTSSIGAPRMSRRAGSRRPRASSSGSRTTPDIWTASAPRSRSRR